MTKIKEQLYRINLFQSTRIKILFGIILFFSTVLPIFQYTSSLTNHRFQLMIAEIELREQELLKKNIQLELDNLDNFTETAAEEKVLNSFSQIEDTASISQVLSRLMDRYKIDISWIYNGSVPELTILSSESKNNALTAIDPEPIESILNKAGESPFFVRLNNEIFTLSVCALPAKDNKQNQSANNGFLIAGKIWSQHYMKQLSAKWDRKVVMEHDDLGSSGNLGFFDSSMDLKVTQHLLGINDVQVVKISSTTFLKSVGEVNERFKRNFRFIALYFALYSIILISFIITRGILPFNFVTRSLLNSNPDHVESLKKRKDEFGQLSRLIIENFKQKQLLVDEIKERLKIEAEYRKLAIATEQSTSAILITNSDGIIEYVNPRFSKITGYSFEEIVGKRPSTLKSGYTKPDEYKEIWKLISSGGVWKGEFMNRKKSGDLYFEASSISPIVGNDGKISHYLSIKEDISELKRNEQLQRVIFNIAHAGGTSASLEELIGRIRIELGKLIDVSNYYLAFYHEETDTFSIPFSNDLRENISGFPAGRTLTAYVLRQKKSLLGTDKLVNQLIQSGEVQPTGVKAKVWMGVPLINNNVAYGVFVVLSYKNENAFSKLDLEMLEFVSHEISAVVFRKQMNEKLNEVLIKAQESDRLKSAFLANMSHEIRTPLNSILGFSTMIADPSTDPSKFVAYNSVIQKNGLQLLTVINNLLDFAKIDTEQIKLTITEFSVKHLIYDLIKEYQPKAIEKGLVIDVHAMGTSEATVRSDRKKVAQIFDNLLSNAIKFTNKGKISFSIMYEAEGLIVEVKDTGIGISSEFVKNVFKKFQQGESSKTRRYSGNGLGLAITKSLVELLQGRIWFESEVHKGTSFRVYLPFDYH